MTIATITPMVRSEEVNSAFIEGPLKPLLFAARLFQLFWRATL